jgi:prophage regulatory protein
MTYAVEQVAVDAAPARRARKPLSAKRALALVNRAADRAADDILNAGRIISMKETMQITGWSRTSIYRLVNESKFCKPVKMGERRVGFVEGEVRGYVADKLRGRDRAGV